MIIPQNVIDELISQARQDAPNETCGYLLGITSDEGDVVTEHRPLTKTLLLRAKGSVCCLEVRSSEWSEDPR